MTSRWPKDDQAALIAFYGMPKTAALEAHLVDVVPPFKMYYEGKGKPIRAIKFHEKAAGALRAALDDIWEAYGKNQAAIDADGVSSYDGAYNPRYIRGSTTKWSNHAFACAIDIDGARNGFNTGHGTMPQKVVDAFKRQGARWGGDYHSRTDPMHFEFCDPGEAALTGITSPRPHDPANPTHDVAPNAMTKILATEFGGGDDAQEGAYGGMVEPDGFGVALPLHFEGKRQNVEVKYKGRAIIAAIVDVGPHNKNDPYWVHGERPRAEAQAANQKKNDSGNEVTNGAGIDMTPACFDALAIPGPENTRSALVDWSFTDYPVTDANSSDPAKTEEHDEAEKPASTSIAVPNNGGHDTISVEVVQRRLLALGYREIGNIDGIMGGKTVGAIAAFKSDRRIDPPTGEIDSVLKDEISKASNEGWKRPIKEERRTATEATVEKTAPELTPVRQNRFTAFWGAIVAAGSAAISAVGDNFGSAFGYLQQGKDLLGQVPGWIWLVLIAGGLAFFYTKSKQGAAAIADSYRKGERN